MKLFPVLSASSIALAVLVATSSATGALQWVLPIKIQRVNYGYFDPAYWKGETLKNRRQHLGVDLRANAGNAVYSPVTGIVITNKTSSTTPVGEAYLVIRAANGEEHVLGHIWSTLNPGARVLAGLQVGTVRTWPNNTHLHWGVNRGKISSVSVGSWGWGRAPYEATAAQAKAKGWVNINSYVGLAETIKAK